MRLVIARCQVDYAGRLTAHLPMATRLILLKADGSVSIHADDRAYKPLNSGHASTASKRDGDWLVRSVAGTTAEKTYRCPGCQQLIGPGTPHLVAWPSEPTGWSASSGVAERRHWHTACWQRRL